MSTNGGAQENDANTMSNYVEPETIATFNRSWKDRKEELRLERGEYNGRPTYTLRVYWQTDDGSWRWSSQKPTQSGKCWERLGLKAKELRELGEALIAEANSHGDRATSAPRGPQSRNSSPRNQAELDRFDNEHTPFQGDSRIPF